MTTAVSTVSPTTSARLSVLSWATVATLVLVALNLRPALAAVGPLLQSIQAELGLSYSQASLLTALPVVMMGLVSFVGFKLAKPLGLERSIAAALLVLAIATGARLWVPSGSALVLTAVAAGFAIAMVQTLMPAIIKQRFGLKAPLVMGFYVTAIMAGAAIAATSAPLLADYLSWRESLGHWLWLALGALVVWCAVVVRKLNFHTVNTQSNATSSTKAPILAAFNHWRISRSWQLALFFALGTSCYVSVLAWLAPYAQELGYSARQAGLLLGFLTGCEVIAGIAFPWWAAKLADKRRVILVLCALQLVGFTALALMPTQALLVWVALIGLGIGGIFPMAMIITMDHIDDPFAAGRLTAFVQGVGYLLAALAPWGAGLLRDLLQSFSLAWLMLAASSLLTLWLGAKFRAQSYRQHYPDKA